MSNDDSRSPAIVVIAFNRPESLTRLLGSLSLAEYPASGVQLVISVDYSGDDSVGREAERFNWPHGEKRIILHKENQGLQNHILKCGDLVHEYGAVILLEDDLYVSEQFFTYAQAALGAYDADHRIAGVSLYAHGFCESSKCKFLPLSDPSDVFFMALAASSGQCFNERQWACFREWCEQRPDVSPSSDTMLPHDMQRWPDSSWKIYFNQYLMQQGLFFVYPRKSLSTNCGDAGTHYAKSEAHFQVPLQHERTVYRFIDFDESLSKYDTHCELLPESLKKMLPELGAFDFTVDLYGEKKVDQVQTELLLSSRSCSQPICSYGLTLKPHEMNIVYQISGNDIQLGKVEDFSVERSASPESFISYHFNIPAEYLCLVSEIRRGRQAIRALNRKEFDQALQGYDAISRSSCWKMTAPLRSILNYLGLNR